MHAMPTFTPEQRSAFQKAAIAHGAERAIALPQIIAKIDELLRSIYPPLLLAVVANYGLTAFVTDRGVEQPAFAKQDFSQHHIELFQALALRMPRTEWGGELLTADAVEPLVEALTEAAHAFFLQRLQLFKGAATDEQQLLLQFQERLRLHTQVVRNWGSYDQVVSHSKRLYGPLDAKLKQALGLSATELIQVFEGQIERIETLTTKRTTKLGQAFNRRFSRDQMIEKWVELNPGFEHSAADLIADLPPNPTRENIMALIFAHADLGLQEFYEITANVAAGFAGSSEEDTRRVLDLLCLEGTDAAEQPVEHLFLDNPVWSRPLMRSASGGYFSAAPQVFFSHVHRIFGDLCRGVGLESELADTRAAYLEGAVHDVVASALPHARVVSNLRWRSEEQEFETDTVAYIDRTLLIFEAKSGSISDPALRGAPARAKRHVQDLIEEPSTQSSRFQKLVEDAQAGASDAQDALRGLNLWPIEVDRFVRATITLDDFSVLSSAEGELRKLGWIAPDSVLAPAMTLADIEVVVDILENEACITHYLWERGRLQKRFDIFGDELDWLGLYLNTAFAFAGTEQTDLDGMMISGLSGPIDDYINAREQGIATLKPRLAQSRLWREMLGEIARRRFPGWISASIALLRAASPDEQAEMASAFQKILRRVPAAWRKPDRKNAMHILPRYADAVSVVLFGYPSLDLAGQRAEAQMFAQKSFASSNVDVCLTIGFNADKLAEPLEYLALIRRVRTARA
ncbi:MAG: hypothetical protein FD124_1164 [Alphaproteobacteria bacterium]|nr:MAG: hypothetical protein FD160_1838 [Caulobacteraceae bacterium]TPW07412.1 MAG: hypothetical protein FD124_1164 [Alphaproteobacteria bacterium]